MQMHKAAAESFREHYVDRLDINAEIECFNLIHGECTPPYDELPEGYISEVCEKSTAEPTGSSSSGCSVGSSTGGSTLTLAMMALLGMLLWRRRPRRAS